MKKTKLQTKKGFKKLSFEEAKVKLKRPVLKAKKVSLKRGSMTKPIAPQMREELAEDPFMRKCCLRGVGNSNECEGEIQWHHNLIYAGKRINEKGAILPLCKFHHEKESKHKFLLNAIMNNRMTDEDRAKYPRKKWL